jgi:hypothetical protein
VECTVEENIVVCTCTYDCERRGKCCECVAYHRKLKQVPGCFFSKEAEKSYDRSVSRFVRENL